MFKPFFKLAPMVCRFALMSSVLVGLLVITGRVQAHELRPAVADVTIAQSQMHVELQAAVVTLLVPYTYLTLPTNREVSILPVPASVKENTSSELLNLPTHHPT